MSGPANVVRRCRLIIYTPRPLSEDSADRVRIRVPSTRPRPSSEDGAVDGPPIVLDVVPLEPGHESYPHIICKSRTVLATHLDGLPRDTRCVAMRDVSMPISWPTSQLQACASEDTGSTEAGWASWAIRLRFATSCCEVTVPAADATSRSFWLSTGRAALTAIAAAPMLAEAPAILWAPSPRPARPVRAHQHVE